MKIEWVQQCKACNGTGLYVGVGERDGAAVVCHQCNGTGRQVMTVEYEEFTGLKSRDDVQLVYQGNPGICVNGAGAVPGGISYEQWMENPDAAKQPGCEMREHTCPKWWFQAVSGSGKEVNWKKCNEGVGWGGRFSNCSHFDNKAKCWQQLDAEQERKS